MNAGSRIRFLADIGKKSVLFQAKLTVNMPIALDSISVPGHQENYNLLVYSTLFATGRHRPCRHGWNRRNRFSYS